MGRFFPSPVSGVRSYFLFFPLPPEIHIICRIGPSFPFVLPVYLSSWRMAVSPDQDEMVIETLKMAKTKGGQATVSKEGIK